jgi:hypothetical protein
MTAMFADKAADRKLERHKMTQIGEVETGSAEIGRTATAAKNGQMETP